MEGFCILNSNFCLNFGYCKKKSKKKSESTEYEIYTLNAALNKIVFSQM